MSIPSEEGEQRSCRQNGMQKMVKQLLRLSTVPTIWHTFGDVSEPEAVTVEDYVAIQRLLARSADAVTRRDVDLFLGCWVEEGVWHIGLTRGSLNGRSEIAAAFPDILAGIEAMVQTVDNGDAWYESGSIDVARSRFYLTELVRRRSGETTLLRFFYADRLVRTADGWRYAERTLNPIYVGPYDLSGPFQSSSADYSRS